MAKRKLIPIFIPQGGCKNHCVYCNQQGITGCNDIPREHQLNAIFPRDTDVSWELAYYGGTFTSLPRNIMLRYLEFGLTMRKAERIGSIRISTHPSYVDDDVAVLLKRYGVTTVELGIQSMDDFVLEKAGRGHGKSEILKSIEILKRHGFLVGAQLMTGLPGDNREKVLLGIRELLPYRLDMVRIYPLLVLEGTPLAKLWREGLFQPQTLEEAIALVTDMYAIFKFQGIPVIRMGLQPTEDLNLNSSFLLAGPFHPSFGYLVQCNLKKKQMEMLAEGYGDDIRFLCSREDMPLLFGEKRKNVEAFSKKRRCGVSAVSLERGTVALAPFDKKQREHRIRTLTEREFLAEYMKQLQFWSEMCI